MTQKTKAQTEMAKLKYGPRLRRIVGFLLAVREPQVAKHLRRSGFTEVELREGAQLLAAALNGRLDETPSKESKVSLRKELKRFAREWLSVVRHALERHYPEVADRLLAGLTWTEGADTANLVTILLQRLEEMDDATGVYGEAGPRARAVLAARGLTAEVVAEITSTLHTLGEFNGTEDELESAQPDPRAELRKAEEAAWAWYREWSGIARAVITDKGALYKLGFGRKPRGLAAADEGESSSDGSTVAVIVNATPVGALPTGKVPAESSAGLIASPQLARASAVPVAAKVEAA